MLYVRRTAALYATLVDAAGQRKQLKAGGVLAVLPYPPLNLVLAVGCLLIIGWEKPFKHWVVKPPPATTPPPEMRIRQDASAPGNWMWDPDRAGPLDRGQYNRDDHVTRAPEIYFP